MKKEIVIFGAGGHAKVVLDIIQKENRYNAVALYSLDKRLEKLCNIPHFHSGDFKESKIQSGIVAIGDNSVREKVVSEILEINPNFEFINAVHPFSSIANGVVLGAGICVMAGVVLNSDAKIGDHVILNTNSSVDHDCTIENFSSIAPGVIIGGLVKIGQGSAISIGAKVIHGITVGADSVIGAGSVVVKNVEAGIVAYGNPCKVIRHRKKGDKYL